MPPRSDPTSPWASVDVVRIGGVDWRARMIRGEPADFRALRRNRSLDELVGLLLVEPVFVRREQRAGASASVWTDAAVPGRGLLAFPVGLVWNCRLLAPAWRGSPE